MNKTESFPYIPFNKFVFRTPCFPLDNDKKNLDSKVFSEAIFLASPDLYKEFKRRDTLDDNDKRKVDRSIWKYFSRACSRCTPFGLFAGCSIGEFGDITSIKMKDIGSYERVTRLDMNYLCSVIQYLEGLPIVRDQLKYFPNDSIYSLGGRIRYVEYYINKVRRVHHISSVEESKYLSNILFTSQNGATIKTLASSISDEEISYEDANNFIIEMIEAQLLKSELEAAVTGGDPLDTLLNLLEPVNSIGDIKQNLHTIRNILHEIDSLPIGESESLYYEIMSKIREIGVEFNLHNIFQTDMYKPTETAVLSREFVNLLTPAINFLNKITITNSKDNPRLNKFKEEFQTMYGDEEIPLCHVLDIELGLGYPVTTGDTGDLNPLIDDLILPRRNRNDKNVIFDYVQEVLLKKYTDSCKQNSREIILSDDDFPELDYDWKYAPDTLDVFCSIISNDDYGYLTYLKFIGTGSCAANLLGRFCHLNKSIENISLEITAKEQALNDNLIIAEIAHLPESRIGNIVSRPVLRKYEIPYLCKSGVSNDYKIPLSDITVSVKQNRIVLKSIKHNSEILPRLTTAHNYSFNSMPIYHFLCDMQMQDRYSGFMLRWGEWANALNYRQRVKYGNSIICREMWNISEENVNEYKDDSKATFEWFKDYRNSRNIPAKFIVPERDNELLIDSGDPLSMEVFLRILKKQKKIQIEEFVFEQGCKITPGFANEFILTFHRTNS